MRAVLAKYDLPHTEKDIIQNPAFRWEMETQSGQPLSPSNASADAREDTGCAKENNRSRFSPRTGERGGEPEF